MNYYRYFILFVISVCFWSVTLHAAESYLAVSGAQTSGALEDSDVSGSQVGLRYWHTLDVGFVFGLHLLGELSVVDDPNIEGSENLNYAHGFGAVTVGYQIGDSAIIVIPSYLMGSGNNILQGATDDLDFEATGDVQTQGVEVMVAVGLESLVLGVVAGSYRSQITWNAIEFDSEALSNDELNDVNPATASSTQLGVMLGYRW